MIGKSILARNVNYLRWKAGLSPNDLRSKAQIPSGFISGIEHDLTADLCSEKLLNETISELAKFFGISDRSLKFEKYFPPFWGTREAELALQTNIFWLIENCPRVLPENFKSYENVHPMIVKDAAEKLGLNFWQLFTPELFSWKNIVAGGR